MRSQTAKLLALSPVVPYPPQSGGDIRSFHLLRRLSKSFEVHLLSEHGFPNDRLIDETGIAASYVLQRPPRPEDVSNVPLGWLIKKKIAFWRGAPHGMSLDIDPAFARAVQRLVARIRFDAVFVDHLFMMQYARFVHPTPVFFSATDVETTKFRRWYGDGDVITRRRRVLHWAQQQVIRFHESRIGRKAVVVFATSQLDRDLLQRMNRKGRFVVAPNGVDLAYFQARSRETFNGPPAILFVGTMYYKPNHQGAQFLASEVFPGVRREIPEATCHLAGKTEGHSYPELHQPAAGVHMHGHVPDIRSYIARSQVMVVPLFIGSGTRIKIVEAMASGTPVVATSIGAEGLNYSNGENIVIADSAVDMVAAIVSLLNDRERAARIGAAGRRLVEREYTWDASADVVRQEITRAIDRDHNFGS